ncbi:MAG: enolase C-terminal domain-like protein [Candidatus Latescibacterota bacterium]|nr:enolase C-terminal domain-like protein [Candidatus Latescibacterota bacterium]
MKITKVDVYQVEIPPIPVIAKYYPKIYDIMLVRVSTDEGVTGWGEAQGVVDNLLEAAQACVGEEPLKADPFVRPDALTCAFLDIAGQAWGIPLHRFFGTQVRDRVPVSYWSCPMTPEETAAEAEVGARLGFHCHKLKARPDTIVETVKRIKDTAGPDYTVGVDPNTQFVQPSTAARLAAELEPFGTVANFEDPVLKDNLDWYRLLRKKTWIPQALHLSTPQDVLAALKAEAVDYLNFSATALETRKLAAIADSANVPVWVQMGGLCLGVLAAYSVHIQATIPNATLPCDELPFTRVADITGGSLIVNDGHFEVPTEPGLGIQVDLEVVEKYRVG